MSLKPIFAAQTTLISTELDSLAGVFRIKCRAE